MKLTAQIVHDTFLECLFKDGESTDNYKLGEAVLIKVGFNPKRLKEKEPLIDKLLKELPTDIHKNIGGGISFLNMCVDINDNQWGEHKNIDELVALGIATGKLSFLTPRKMWNLLPGGMPYLVLNLIKHIMTTISVQCKCCGKNQDLDVDPISYTKWQKGMLIQNAFPDMSADDRELLISGTCTICWEEMFPEEDETP